MVDPQTETNNLTLEQAAGLLLQTPQQEGTSAEAEASQPDDTELQDQVLPLEEEAEAESDMLEAADADEEDQTADDAYEAEVEEQDVYTVRVNGEDIDVTLDEALKGYQREADYTRKTQKVSEDRKALDADIAEFQAVKNETLVARDRYLESLKAIAAHEQQQMGQEPDWATLKDQMDAKDFALAMQNWNQKKENTQRINAEAQRVQREKDAENAQAMQTHLANEAALMLQKIPGWGDDKGQPTERMKTEREELVAHAKTMGFTDEEIAGAADHRSILLLHDSLPLKKLLEKNPEAKKKVAKAPKSPRPGVPRSKNEVAQRRRQKGREQHIKNPSIASAVALLEARNQS